MLFNFMKGKTGCIGFGWKGACASYGWSPFKGLEL